MRLTFLFCTALVSTALAQDGGQLYTTYCSACHASDGKGATGGQFPPLAGSSWLSGDPDRAIKIVLHGLDGPVDVNGRTFNLVMPPQGAALPDDYIAAILTYVRSSWGNQWSKVDPATVKAIRDKLSARNQPWTQEELLKLHPLPKPTSNLENLTSRIYHGNWKDLPDFSKLEAINIEEEHDGIISVSHADRDHHFGLVWEGDFVAPKAGKYTFLLNCDDGGRVVINGKTIAEVRGTGPLSDSRAKQGSIKLAAGPHPIRIEYYENSGSKGITLAWKGAGIKNWQNLSDRKAAKPTKTWPSIPIEPAQERAAIYRNFIDGTTPRAIGIGLPGGVNFAYSADHLAPELIWQGAFMDGGRHWTARGQGNQPPAGSQIIKLTSRKAYPDGARFRGYELDPAGNPSFAVSCDGLQINDSYRGSDKQLQRRVETSGKGTAIELLISGDVALKQIGPQRYALNDGLEIQIDQGSIENKGRQSFLKLIPGQTITLTYTWK